MRSYEYEAPHHSKGRPVEVYAGRITPIYLSGFHAQDVFLPDAIQKARTSDNAR